MSALSLAKLVLSPMKLLAFSPVKAIYGFTGAVAVGGMLVGVMTSDLDLTFMMLFAAIVWSVAWSAFYG